MSYVSSYRPLRDFLFQYSIEIFDMPGLGSLPDKFTNFNILLKSSVIYDMYNVELSYYYVCGISIFY